MNRKERIVMVTQTSRFDRLLLSLLIVLFAVSLGAFSYLNWVADPEPVLWTMMVSAFILAIPLGLFYGSIYILVRAWREHALHSEISPRQAKVIHWAPRIAAILIIFFVSLFSLDVFEMEATRLELLVGFLIHSLPSIFMILVLVVAWRRPVVGFVAFLIAGLFFLRFVIFDLNLGHFLLFSGTLLLVSALFYADWRWLKPESPSGFKAA
jgi:hypothetical protein